MRSQVIEGDVVNVVVLMRGYALVSPRLVRRAPFGDAIRSASSFAKVSRENSISKSSLMAELPEEEAARPLTSAG